jgi:hypothetical protein
LNQKGGIVESLRIAIYRRERIEQIDTAIVFLREEADPPRIPGYSLVTVSECTIDALPEEIPTGVIHAGSKKKPEAKTS